MSSNFYCRGLASFLHGEDEYKISMMLAGVMD